MRTSYMTNYAITSFDTLATLYQFISNPAGLQLLDIDYQRRYVKWKF
jgi:hypothetical protein